MTTSREIIAEIVGDEDAASVLAALAEGGYGVVAASPLLVASQPAGGKHQALPWRNPVAREVGASVLGEVTRRSGWPSAALLSGSRDRDLVKWRHVAMAATRRSCGASYPALAEFFDRDHTTIIHAVRKVEESQLLSGLMVEIVAAVQKARQSNGAKAV